MITTIRDHTLFTNCLHPGAVVIDLGAHKGEFSQSITERFGVTCVAVEANPSLASSIPERPRVDVLNVAITETDGSVEFHVDEDKREASSVYRSAVPDQSRLTQRVDGLSFGSMLSRIDEDTVALVKVDIEGAEIPLLLKTPDEHLSRVAQFSVEFHDFIGLGTREDIASVRERMSKLGFRSIRFSRTNQNWLFFQPALCELKPAEAPLTKWVVRNGRGLGRRLGILPT
jgi:FkbM family methyltransferase